ncbi:alginate lyase family protein [Rouxiella sp. Mn2063]|uniref:alginate lyase family protein n=1 Tax=Rouxiella sp. Mn2063 TaxID=3395262 RepID=UPI003BCD9283
MRYKNKYINMLSLSRLAAGVMLASMASFPLLAAEHPDGQLAFMQAAQLSAIKQQLHDGQAASQTQSAYQHLLKAADGALTKPNPSVTDKGLTPPSGSKHDYLSLSPYWWPDSKKADGLPWVRRDGKVNPASKNAQSDGVRLAQFTSDVQNLTLAWYFSGKQTYADKAIGMLRTWFINPETRMNPNLNFSQGIPGIAPGRSYGVLDGRYFATRIVDSLILLRGNAAWQAQDEQSMQQWMQQYMTWLQSNKLALEERNAENNHGSWYSTQVAGIAWYLKQPQVIKEMSQLLEHKLNKQFAADGAQPQELARTRSFHYSYFNLQAVTLMAVLAQKEGVDVWHYQTPQGGSLIKSLDFMAPYTDDNRPWPYPSLDRVSVIIVPFLSWADNALGQSRYQQQVRSASFNLPEATHGGKHKNDGKGEILEAEQATWLTSLPAGTTDFVAPHPALKAQ